MLEVGIGAIENILGSKSFFLLNKEQFQLRGRHGYDMSWDLYKGMLEGIEVLRNGMIYAKYLRLGLHQW